MIRQCIHIDSYWNGIQHGRRGPAHPTHSTAWPLMTWRCTEPGHQQSWYWLSSPGVFRQQSPNFCLMPFLIKFLTKSKYITPFQSSPLPSPTHPTTHQHQPTHYPPTPTPTPTPKKGSTLSRSFLICFQLQLSDTRTYSHFCLIRNVVNNVKSHIIIFIVSQT